ncbi:MAG: tetratricopeptide repeat protein [Gammaproteobacteria bacterium]
MQKRLFFLITILWLLQSCSTATPRPAPVEDRSAPVSVEAHDEAAAINTAQQEHAGSEQGSPVTPGANPAVIALMDDAQAYVNSGNRETAAATLERALRLEPKNALIWHRLGALRLQQGAWQQALALARKSNALAAGNRSLQAANWQIIARVKEAVQDDDGARHANQMIKRLNSSH